MKQRHVFFALIFVLLLGVSCERKKNLYEEFETDPKEQKMEAAKKFALIEWQELIPLENRSDDLLEKLQQELAQYEDYDPKAIEVYEKYSADFSNAPTNTAINESGIRLEGYIAPLEVINGKVSEFLLVPYFGACIHYPPPPLNQTIMVKLAPGFEILSEQVYDSFIVGGVIKISKQATDIGSAGYLIEDAIIL